MKRTISFAILLFTSVLLGSWTNNNKSINRTNFKKKDINTNFLSSIKFYDAGISFYNGSYFNARVSISNSSGYYKVIPASPHAYGNGTVPPGTYNVSVVVDAYSANPNISYNYYFTVGSQTIYGGTSAYFTNVTISTSLSIHVS